jgi:ribosomal protein L37AE/L43A
MNMDDPEECPLCNDFPDFEEIADGQFQCKNCGAVIKADGTIIEEGDQTESEEDELWDEE